MLNNEKIKIIENANLVLRNVMEYELPINKEEENAQMLEMKINNYLKINGIKEIGRRAVYSSLNLSNENSPFTVKYLIQVEKPSSIINNLWTFNEELRIKNCIVARYNGPTEKAHLAGQKLAVLAYENEIELTGETFTVMLAQENNLIAFDMYMPRR